MIWHNVIGDYRPIACYNVVYKDASKLICSRLKAVLPSIISKNQGGFFQGRFIAHNVMICQDLICLYGRKVVKPSCLIKLDTKKVYDSLEWDFIEEVLTALEFSVLFINLVMQCISTTRYTLSFNAACHGYFEARKGLRQGDPMSPLIFVAAMKYLSCILSKVADKEGYKFHDRCETLKLNNLMFADDVLIFCHGDYRSIYYMLQGLALFSISSGLFPNPEKTALYCHGMEAREVKRIVDVSGYKLSRMPFHYLGVPISMKRLNKDDESKLIEKMTSRIRTWSTRNLSYAGRIMLINSVLMAIQTYWSQIVVLPNKIFKSIINVCRAFLWKSKADFAGLGAIAWEHICYPKKAGGLGLRNLRCWNKAVMLKHVWALDQKKESLWLQWIHHVYLKQGESI